MSKFSVLCATVLMAVAGAASAGTIPVLEGTTTYTFSKDSKPDSTTAAVIPVATQSAGVIVDYTFSYTGTLERNDFLGLWFGSSDGPSFGLKANRDSAKGTDDLFVRNSANGTVSYISGSDLVAGQQYHLFAYLYKTGNSSGVYTALDFWVDPTAEEMATLTGADARAVTNSALTSFSDIGFRTANISGDVVLTVGNVNVTAVPEPGSLALMGLAAAGLGFARRRKSA